MEFKDKLKNLRTRHKLTQSELSRKLNINRTSISKYENGIQIPEIDVLKAISNFFEVSLDYLMDTTHTNDCPIPSRDLSEKDNNDIAKDLDSMMSKIDAGEDGPVYYNGQAMDQDDRELFKDAIEFALKRIKIENKERHTPKKYR